MYFVWGGMVIMNTRVMVVKLDFNLMCHINSRHNLLRSPSLKNDLPREDLLLIIFRKLVYDLLLLNERCWEGIVHKLRHKKRSSMIYDTNFTAHPFRPCWASRDIPLDLTPRLKAPYFIFWNWNLYLNSYFSSENISVRRARMKSSKKSRKLTCWAFSRVRGIWTQKGPRKHHNLYFSSFSTWSAFVASTFIFFRFNLSCETKKTHILCLNSSLQFSSLELIRRECGRSTVVCVCLCDYDESNT